MQKLMMFACASLLSTSVAMAADDLKLTTAEGPFQPAWESLESQYQCPEWFRDAKLGIWAHWTAQCVPEQGDWYARSMYIQYTRARTENTPAEITSFTSSTTAILRSLASRTSTTSGRPTNGSPRS